MIVPLQVSAYAHSDLLNSILLALRDGVKSHRIHPDVAEPVLTWASHSDCNVCRRILEAVLSEGQV